MKPAGGLKLQLRTANRDDRRVRFAGVVVEPVGGLGSRQHLGGGAQVPLVTDARGRLRYHLPAGDYRLQIEGAPDTPFTVSDRGWTAVRVPLG